MLQPLSLIIQEILPGSVAAKTSDGQVWRFPLNAFHGTPKVGQEIRVIAVPTGGEEAGKSAFAKTLLNELLGNSFT